MAAVFATESGESVIEDATIKVTVNDPFDVRTKIAGKLGKELWQVKYLKKKLRDKILDHFAG